MPIQQLQHARTDKKKTNYKDHTGGFFLKTATNEKDSPFHAPHFLYHINDPVMMQLR